MIKIISLQNISGVEEAGAESDHASEEAGG